MADQIDSDQLSSLDNNSNEPNAQAAKSKKNNNAKPKGKIVINISDCQYPVVSRVSKALGWKLQSNGQATDWDVLWTDNAVQPQTFTKMEAHQKINHFPGMFNLARKNLMGRYLMKMRKKFPDQYSFFPMTWMLPVEYHELKAYFETKQKGKARTFIVKPEALSQGKGIYLTRKLQQIDQNAHCVVQRYMHRPYLIEGLKFDMRVYVLVAGVDPLRLYIYHEGLTRFATQRYEPPTKQNMEDVCMHLTNYAINKDNPKFVFNNSSTDMSKGHKRSLTWLFEYLQKNEPNGRNLKDKIQDMIVKTMISGLPVIANTYRSCQPENYASNMCFELLGFDVMLTDKCEPVLLQINHTPSFTTDTPLDDVIKTNYIRDSLLLMNVSLKSKEQIIKDRREACQQRVLTGKKIKLSNEEKDAERKRAQTERDKYEGKNIGGFKKIYPLDNEAIMDEYQQLFSFAKQSYLHSTGTKKSWFISNKRTEKIESAFGTCFKPKQNVKASMTLKNTENLQEPVKRNNSTTEKNYKADHYLNGIKQEQNISMHGDEKNLSLIDHQAVSKNLSQADEIVENKFDEDMIIKSSSSDPVQGKNMELQGTKENPFLYPMSDPQQVEISKANCNKTRELNFSSQQLSYKGNHAFDEAARSDERMQFCKYTRNESAPKERISNKKSLNSIEIFFEPSTYNSSNSIKCSQNAAATTYTQANYRKNDYAKLGIFGSNQVATDDRKKFKVSIGNLPNPKSSSNIQASELKSKQRHFSNREKIPILLNTLLIGSSEGKKPAVSANNLRKVLGSQPK